MRGVRGLLVGVAVLLFGLLPFGSVPSEAANQVLAQGSGQGGQWILVYQPFDEPRTDVRFSFNVEATATGDGSTPLGLFTSRPALIKDWGDGLVLEPFHVFEPHGPLYVDRSGGRLTYAANETWSARIGGGVYTGLLYFVGATAPWSFELDLTVQGDAQGNGTPVFVSQGDGIHFVPGGQRTLDLTPGGALAGGLTLDAPIASDGWTHLQYEYEALQPEGARDYSFSFPNGFNGTGMGLMYGFHAPFVGGSASSSDWLDMIGTVQGTAGDVASRLDYVQTQTRMDVALVHLPMSETDLPTGVAQGNYVDSNWPFQDTELPLHQSGPHGGVATYQRV